MDNSVLDNHIHELFIPYCDDPEAFLDYYRMVKCDRNGSCGPQNEDQLREYYDDIENVFSQKRHRGFFKNVLDVFNKWKLFGKEEYALLEDENFCRDNLKINHALLSEKGGRSYYVDKGDKVNRGMVDTPEGKRYVYKDFRVKEEKNGRPKYTNDATNTLLLFASKFTSPMPEPKSYRIPYYVIDDLSEFEEALSRGTTESCERDVSKSFRIILVKCKDSSGSNTIYYIYKNVSFDDKGSDSTINPVSTSGDKDRYLFVFDDLIKIEPGKNVCRVNLGAILYYNYTFSFSPYLNYISNKKEFYKGTIKPYIESRDSTYDSIISVPFGSGLIRQPKNDFIANDAAGLGTIFHAVMKEFWDRGKPYSKEFVEKAVDNLKRDRAKKVDDERIKAVKKYLNSYFAGAVFSSVYSNAKSVYPELKTCRQYRCTSPYAEVILHGILDLVYTTDKGDNKLIDYKTTEKEDYAKTEKESEKMQLYVYRYILNGDLLHQKKELKSLALHKIGPELKTREFLCEDNNLRNKKVQDFLDYVNNITKKLTALQDAHRRGKQSEIDKAKKELEDLKN